MLWHNFQFLLLLGRIEPSGCRLFFAQLSEVSIPCLPAVRLREAKFVQILWWIPAENIFFNPWRSIFRTVLAIFIIIIYAWKFNGWRHLRRDHQIFDRIFKHTLLEQFLLQLVELDNIFFIFFQELLGVNVKILVFLNDRILLFWRALLQLKDRRSIWGENLSHHPCGVYPCGLSPHSFATTRVFSVGACRRGMQ